MKSVNELGLEQIYVIHPITTTKRIVSNGQKSFESSCFIKQERSEVGMRRQTEDPRSSDRDNPTTKQH